MTFRDDPSYYESCYRCGDDAIGMTGLCHSCHESAETVEEYSRIFCNCGNELFMRDDESIAECDSCSPDRTTGAFKNV